MIMANLVLRGGGAALVLLLAEYIDIPWIWIGTSEAQQVINLHLVFNPGLALVALPLVGPMSRLMETLLKPCVDPRAGLGPASALDPATLNEPHRASRIHADARAVQAE